MHISAKLSSHLHDVKVQDIQTVSLIFIDCVGSNNPSAKGL